MLFVGGWCGFQWVVEIEFADSVNMNSISPSYDIFCTIWFIFTHILGKGTIQRLHLEKLRRTNLLLLQQIQANVGTMNEVEVKSCSSYSRFKALKTRRQPQET